MVPCRTRKQKEFACTSGDFVIVWTTTTSPLELAIPFLLPQTTTFSGATS